MKLKKLSSPIIMWSKNLIPSKLLHLTNRKVSLISCLLGVESPLGWLWTRIMLVELVIIVVLKTSEGVVCKEFIVPIDIIDIEVT